MRALCPPLHPPRRSLPLTSWRNHYPCCRWRSRGGPPAGHPGHPTGHSLLRHSGLPRPSRPLGGVTAWASRSGLLAPERQPTPARAPDPHPRRPPFPTPGCRDSRGSRARWSGRCSGRAMRCSGSSARAGWCTPLHGSRSRGAADDGGGRRRPRRGAAARVGDARSAPAAPCSAPTYAPARLQRPVGKSTRTSSHPARGGLAAPSSASQRPDHRPRRRVSPTRRDAEHHGAAASRRSAIFSPSGDRPDIFRRGWHPFSR